MMPMGQLIGTHLVKSRKLYLLLIICFIMGVMITVAEPDLQVLAEQVPAIPNLTLILSISLGVGVFLLIAVLRVLLKIRLSILFLCFYALVFTLAAFTPGDYLAVAFDSGGVTTGPITVPFILALGVGIAAVRGSQSTEDDSFGMVALCSVGPIMAVMIMGMLFNSPGQYSETEIVHLESIRDIFTLYAKSFPRFLEEVALALSPIIFFFIIFQLLFLKLPRVQLIKMGIGIIYTYLGLVIFLTSVNTGFMPVGNYLGGKIALYSHNWVLIPIGMFIGFFIVAAEPAVHVLNNQVEEISSGAISKRAMLLSLSSGVGISLALAMLRVMTGISIWYILVPGYLTALILTFFVPKVFTAIAFDSGGVASGPMTATFLLPFTIGVCTALGGDLMRDAFGTVAMVAMTPLITIQLLGLVYGIKTKKAELAGETRAEVKLDTALETDIIDLDED